MFNDLFYVYSVILGERRKGIETVANNFFNINKTNNHEKDITYKRFCNYLQWVHSKSKYCKPKNYNHWDQENQNVKSGQ